TKRISHINIFAMKVHTTNYFNTFIEVAEDTKVDCGTKPPSKHPKTIAELQFDLIDNNPYKFTSDDVSFQVYAERNGIPKSEITTAKTAFFSKGQACFRSSPLTKTYGFGMHFDHKGRVALYGMETSAYKKFV